MPVSALLDGSFGSRLAAAGLPVTTAVPDYVRDKPPDASIVAYRFRLDDGTWTRGYAHRCDDIARADRIHHKAARFRPLETDLGHGALRLDPNTVVYGFPTDARLRRLRWYTTARKLKRSLARTGFGIKRESTIEILRYKPERRVVARIDLATDDGPRPLLLRYTAERRAGHLARTAHALRAGGVDCPETVGVLEDGRVSVDQFVSGRQLLDVVRNGGGDAVLIAERLLRVHAVTPPVGTALRTRADDLWRIHTGLRGMAGRRPSLEPAARSLDRALGRRAPLGLEATRLGLVHGDLHAENVLVDDHTVWFVDLERVAVAPPAVDLGTLLAHALADDVRRPGWSPGAVPFARAVVEAFRAASPPGRCVDDRELVWYTAIGLVDQAVLAGRRLEDRWHETCGELLDLAHGLLDRGCGL